MKLKVLFFLLLLPVSMMSFCQTGNGEEIILDEAFLPDCGTLYVRSFHQIGKIKNLEMEVVEIKDPILVTQKSFVRLTYYPIPSSRTLYYWASLELQDLDNLITSLTYFNFNILPQRPEDYTEVIYRLENDFMVAAFADKNQNWKVVVKLTEDDASRCKIDATQLPLLIGYFSKAKKYIEEVDN